MLAAEPGRGASKFPPGPGLTLACLSYSQRIRAESTEKRHAGKLTHGVALFEAAHELLQRDADDGCPALGSLGNVELPPKQRLLQVVRELLLLQGREGEVNKA
jgi:hypothetical protein